MSTNYVYKYLCKIIFTNLSFLLNLYKVSEIDYLVNHPIFCKRSLNKHKKFIIFLTIIFYLASHIKTSKLAGI